MADHPPNPSAGDGLEADRHLTLEHGKVGDTRLQSVHAQLIREKEEPTEGFTPIPIFLLFIFSTAIFWGGIYLERYSGDFKWYAYDPDFEAHGGGAEAPVDTNSPEWLMARGEKLFVANCATCHQVSGMGSPGVYPPLVGSPWVTGSENRLVKLVLYGMSGPIEVLGNTYNGNMPAFSAHPSFRRDRDLAAVFTYIRNSWGNTAVPILEAQVTEVRASVGDRAPWTAEELLAQYPLE